jgi:peptide/nickel transport system ATP-binding protein
MPYTEALLQSIPSLTAPPHTRQRTIPGRPPDPLDPAPGCPFAPRCRYARDRCHAETPPLVAAETPDHEYACWYPLRSPLSVSDDGPAALTRVHKPEEPQ